MLTGTSCLTNSADFLSWFESETHRVTCLNTWFPDNDTIWEGYGSCGKELSGVSTSWWTSFEVYSLAPLPALTPTSCGGMKGDLSTSWLPSGFTPLLPCLSCWDKEQCPLWNHELMSALPALRGFLLERSTQQQKRNSCRPYPSIMSVIIKQLESCLQLVLLLGKVYPENVLKSLSLRLIFFINKFSAVA